MTDDFYTFKIRCDSCAANLLSIVRLYRVKLNAYFIITIRFICRKDGVESW